MTKSMTKSTAKAYKAFRSNAGDTSKVGMLQAITVSNAKTIDISRKVLAKAGSRRV